MANKEIISAIFPAVWLARKSATVWSCSTLAGPIADVSGGFINTDVVFNVGVEKDYDLTPRIGIDFSSGSSRVALSRSQLPFMSRLSLVFQVPVRPTKQNPVGIA